MSQGAQRSTEQQIPSSPKITSILYNNAFSDGQKISLLTGLFPKTYDQTMIRGIVNDKNISTGEKNQILQALHRLAVKEAHQAETIANNNLVARRVTVQDNFEKEIATSKKVHYEKMETEYNAMMLSAQKKADAYLAAQEEELEASFQSRMAQQQREIDDELRQYKLGAIESIMDELKVDKQQLADVMRVEIIEDLQSQLNIVREKIIEAELILEDFIENNVEAVEFNEAVTVETTTATPNPGIVVERQEDSGVLSKEVTLYIASKFADKPITSYKILVSNYGNNYCQVNINNGEFFLMFDHNGKHKWTDGPFN